MKRLVLALAVLQRICLFFWGLYQDATMVVRYTDVDYMVFTDASRFVAEGLSPYARDTYRYTPLLAWMLLPTASEWPGMFHFGKVLFMIGDIVAGDLLIRIFQLQGFSERDACLYSNLWLLNPMVSTISTRGSSEGLLGAIVILMVWAANSKRYVVAGLTAGLAVHFKIYPFIYLPTILWSIGPARLTPFVNSRMKFLGGAILAFMTLTGLMVAIYGTEYLEHSWLHHLTRLDHRHNFSVYSTVLYYASATGGDRIAFERWAFIPQLLLSGVVLPLAFARRNVERTMVLQTLAFVTFNKVCTSQYFLWYMVLLPFYIPQLRNAPRRKYVVLTMWILLQGLWVYHAYQLEFLGRSTFFPHLFWDTVLFFGANIWGICFLITCI